MINENQLPMKQERQIFILTKATKKNLKNPFLKNQFSALQDRRNCLTNQMRVIIRVVENWIFLHFRRMV
jgi:hypothetical protein